jgi:hypothetical protein
MKPKNKLALVLAFTATAISAHGATNVISWAYSNGTSVNGSAGVVLASNWNQTQEAGSTDLLYSDATSSGTTISLSGGFGAWGIGGVSSPDLDGNTNKAILDGYYNSFGSTATIGSIPFSQYDLIVYFSSDVDGRTGTVSDGTTTFSFSTMGIAATSGSNAIFTQTTNTGAGNPSADYAVFSGLTGASKIISIQSIPSSGMGIAGIQIVQVPEPGVTSLLGLCGAGFVLIRRRTL